MRFTVRPKFCVRDESSDDKVCEKCRYHKIIIVGKAPRSDFIYAWTDIGLSVGQLNSYLHYWSGSHNVPGCLAYFKETGYVNPK